jgi:hypothetical protein
MRQSPPDRAEVPENPIFEETSAWFRENWVAPDSTDSDHVWNRPLDRIPARGDSRDNWDNWAGPDDQWRDDRNNQGAVASAPGAEQSTGRPGELTPLGSPGDRVLPLVDTASASDGADAAPDPWAGAVRGEAVRQESAPEPRPEAWADSSLLDPMPEEPTETELTAAGLPKRKPKAQLIPGGPNSAPGGEDGESAGVPRSADQVRGRLASYQSGVRQGRESRLRRLAEASNARSSGGHDSATHNGKENG